MTIALAFGYAVLIWWASTVLVLYLDGLPLRTYRWSLLLATVLLLVSWLAVIGTRDENSAAAAYCSFTTALLIWFWLELSYFTGWITGPRKTACPPGCRGLRRFVLAIQASLYHELLVILFGVALFFVTRDSANQVAFSAYLVLWLMRWSAKLNLFFGVRNLNADWLPEHLQFLTSYMRQRSMNVLFPVSIVLATTVFGGLATQLVSMPPDDPSANGVALVAALLLLAIIEHWLLVLPLPTSAMWSWGMRSHQESHDEGAAIRQRSR
jgi:putative photosynthetic complex assembly protein 2